MVVEPGAGVVVVVVVVVADELAGVDEDGATSPSRSPCPTTIVPVSAFVAPVPTIGPGCWQMRNTSGAWTKLFCSVEPVVVQWS